MDGNVYSKEEIVSTGVVEKAIVVQANDIMNIENDQLVVTFKELGLTPEEFKKLVAGDFKDVRDPIDEDLSLNGIIEHARLRFAQLGNKIIEVAYCSRKDDSKQPPSEFDFQFRQKDPAYKILVGLKGEGVLSLPKVEPAGLSQMHMYVATPEAQIPFKKGTVAVIQAPTAWSFKSSKAGLEYLYISFPKYSPSIDTVVENTSK